MGKKFISIIIALFVFTSIVFSISLPNEAKAVGFKASKTKPISNFSIKNIEGKAFTTNDFNDSVAIFYVYSKAAETNPDCLSVVSSLLKQYPNNLYVVSQDSEKDLLEIINTYDIPKSNVFSQAKALIRALGNPKTPSWIVSKDGSIITFKLGTLTKEQAQQSITSFLKQLVIINNDKEAPKTQETTTTKVNEKPTSNSIKPTSNTQKEKTELLTNTNKESSSKQSVETEELPSNMYYYKNPLEIELNTGLKDASFATELEIEVLRELNLARTQPQVYAKIIKDYGTFIKNGIIQVPGQPYYKTNEGIKAVNEAVSVLEKQKAVGPLTLSYSLSKAAKDHVEDQSKTGQTGHNGSNGSTMKTRIEKYGAWGIKIGENISYGFNDARDIIISLIVDDGVPNRGHRKNIYEDNFKTVGISCGTHTVYRYSCVNDYAGSMSE